MQQLKVTIVGSYEGCPILLGVRAPNIARKPSYPYLKASPYTDDFKC